MARVKDIKIPNYSLSEELINSITHGVFCLISIWGLVMLIIKASSLGAIYVVSVTLYGASLVMLYGMSCIYYALSSKLMGKRVFRVLDHCNVFLLVFGTIIPVALLGIGGKEGWICFGIVSFVTVLGIVSSSIAIDRVQVLEVVLHLINGWSVLIYSKFLIENMTYAGFWLIVLGDVFYTVGAIIYGIGSKKKYMHNVFHVFCGIGSLFHYFAIYLYLL